MILKKWILLDIPPKFRYNHNMVWKVKPTGSNEVLPDSALEFLDKLEEIKNRPYGHNDQVKLYYKALKKLKKEYPKGSREWVAINNYMKSQPLKEI